jgi:methionyl-tRNA formyltransferase
VRVVFAGTPPFAAQALEALIAAGFEVPLVLTQPDRPAGRGMKLTPSAVKQVAQTQGIEVFQPATLKNDDDALARLLATKMDVMVVAAYGLILPQAVLNVPQPYGCLNIHASLLPRWRGAAPIQRAIEAGDAETGVGIMQMEAGLDTGPVLLEARVEITADDTAASLHDKLATQGATLITEALRTLPKLQPTEQAAEGVSYAQKISKAEAMLDFNQSAALLERRVRAFNPFPGATIQFEGETLKVWRAHVLEEAHPSTVSTGSVVFAEERGIALACADKLLVATEVQRAGGKRQSAATFLRTSTGR